ncbi:hypothetical protein L1987_02061 [Smallanthus sonchifolius]|uniref:Uncharacterized protein n=1 Tax=Smallanthus sonchifolius TaxID=185202 RepID=A0ACB9K6R2_9ASTR|nr:hypothetical protein L1987_02061 [Smallanthus sonchifolius]
MTKVYYRELLWPRIDTRFLPKAILLYDRNRDYGSNNGEYQSCHSRNTGQSSNQSVRLETGLSNAKLDLEPGYQRIEAQGIVINELYANFLRESSSCNTYLSIDLEHENGSEAHPAPSFDVFEQESEAETIMDETQVPPPV